jgi:homocitrate synthase NifV
MQPDKRHINLVDTTLRDGHQAPGLALSLETRESLIKSLDAVGVEWIEALSPGMTHKETLAAKKWSKIPKRAKIIAWNRLNLGDVEASMAAKPHLIHVCFPTSESHLSKKLGVDFEEAAVTLEKCLDLARLNGFEVSVGLEDASRAGYANLTKARSLLRSLAVQNVRLSDTCGVLTPASTRRLVEYFGDPHFNVDFHAHDDLGMADVNSLVAALSGANSVNVSLMGVGERAGNSGLSRFAFLAAYSKDISVKVTPAMATTLEDTYREFLIRSDYMESLKVSPGSDVTDWIGQPTVPPSVND